MKVGVKKLKPRGYPSWKSHDPIVISFDALPACDGQTNWQTDGHVAYG